MLAKKLRMLRKQRDVTQSVIGKLCGVSSQAVAKWENGTSAPDYQTLPKLAKYFDVSLDYLLGEEEIVHKKGFMLRDSNSTIAYVGEAQTPTKPVPIIGSVRCGPNGLAFEWFDGFVYVDGGLKGNLLAFLCRGDSMLLEGIVDGTIAIINQQEEFENGKLFVLTIDGEEGTLKRIRLQPQAIILESANNAYPPRVFVREDMNRVHCVGKVVEIRRKIE